jgi:hypothetical protein
VSANAQTFDEADLVGTWTTTGLAYAPYKITNIESMTLGDNMYEHGDAYYVKHDCWSGFFKNITQVQYRSGSGEEEVRTMEQEQINDFFISNNNKLHIVQESMTFHFIIEELTSTTLKVKTYDGQSYSFTKDGSSGGNSTSTRSNGDVNGDGVVNAADVVKVVEIISGN